MFFLPEIDDGVFLDGQQIAVSRVSCAYERTETRDKDNYVVCEVGINRYPRRFATVRGAVSNVNISRSLPPASSRDGTNPSSQQPPPGLAYLGWHSAASLE